MGDRKTTKTSWDPYGGGTRLARQEAFGHSGVYQLTNVFSHPDFRAFSVQNDHEETTSGSASKTVTAGNLQISTGTTAGSTYRYETADFSVYQPGKEGIGGIGVTLDQALAGTAHFEAGLGDDRNSCHLRRKGDGSTEAVLKIDGTETDAIPQSDWNRDTLDGTGKIGENPSGKDLLLTTRGLTVSVRYNWYSWGSITLGVFFSNRSTPGETAMTPMHTFNKDGLTHFTTPQLPLFCEIDNGDQSTDYTAKIGGRRYDVMGEFKPDTREVASVVREGQTVGATAGVVPLAAFQRKSEYPTGENNTITSFARTMDVRTDQKLQVAWYSVPSASDLTNSSSGGFTDTSAGETSLQGDTSATAMSNAERISEFNLFDSTANNKARLSEVKGLRIPIIRDRPTVLAADNLAGNDATVDTAIGARELM